MTTAIVALAISLAGVAGGVVAFAWWSVARIEAHAHRSVERAELAALHGAEITQLRYQLEQAKAAAARAGEVAEALAEETEDDEASDLDPDDVDGRVRRELERARAAAAARVPPAAGAPVHPAPAAGAAGPAARVPGDLRSV